MKMISRDVFLRFQIDANRINSKGKLGNMNQLEKWDEDGVISIEMSEPAQKEAAWGSPIRAKKADGYIYAISFADTPKEKSKIQKIRAILFPNIDGLDSGQSNDVLIVFSAWKYGQKLITFEGKSKRQPGGMLGNATKLAQLGIIVMSDEEAVQLVKEKIKKRDELARKISHRYGYPLPRWVDKD